MDDSRKNLVSLRGASAREITRDALLERVSHERELRNFARRANSAALFIQRVWRSYNVTMKVALQLQEEWNISVQDASGRMRKTWISCFLLRPFLFFITPLSLRQCTVQGQAVNSMRTCFLILLENLNSTAVDINFCSLAIGTIEEQRMWSYQVKKLVSLCSFMLSDYDSYSLSCSEVAAVTALLMRLVITLTDSRAWKCIPDENLEDADRAVKGLIRFIGCDKSGLFRSIGRYMTKLNASFTLQSLVQKDDKFLITASAITLLLRPFLAFNSDGNESLTLDMQCAAEQYCVYILTVPWLVQRIPALILRALKHKSILMPCFETILILMNYSTMDISGVSSANDMPCVGWVLSNVISLVTGSDNGSIQSSSFTDGVDIVKYVHVLNILADRLLIKIENNRLAKKERLELEEDGSSAGTSGEKTFGSLNYMDLLRPVCQQWHLSKLMVTVKSNTLTDASDCFTLNSDLKQIKGKQKQPSKDVAAKWVNVLHKIGGKSQTNADYGSDGNDSQAGYTQGKTNPVDIWDVESLRCGLESISKEKSCLIHLFCATYAHLLLVLDDIEFYEKQVPFSLEQQRRIASMLNTLVYNGLLHNTGRQNKLIMDAASRCLQMLYERDCRHQFCPPSLWLSPARKNRPPIAMAPRTHEVQPDVRSDDNLTFPSMGSFITVTPHVYPFEERVQMFREFIKMDKTSRRMAGELNAPGERSVAIVVRRGHLVEDGFQQLNSLGTKLKSSIHVSFVSECGLAEAGLDYGGLSKEFLTDISKGAFDPQYGLFCQTSTSERLLIPNTSARFQENGIQMIEFVGRIVGKALYEEILLDFSFSHVFVQKLLGRYCFLDELSTLDPELYRNLMYVKNYEGDVKELSLDFTVTEESYGKMHVIELRPGGKDTTVTNENKLQYVHAMADYKLNRQMLPLSNAFYRGLTDLISPSWLKLFNASEFNQLLSGGNHDIDVDDLRKNTRYTGGYSEGSRTVKLFWEVLNQKNGVCFLSLLLAVHELHYLASNIYSQLLLSIRLHVMCLFGQHLEVRMWSGYPPPLHLPTYKRASTLRAKLLYAINSNAGFELS
ncbi:E3 ubiquitin-protein ligase UPL7 [Bienertia sinuspersici]